MSNDPVNIIERKRKYFASIAYKLSSLEISFSSHKRSVEIQDDKIKQATRNKERYNVLLKNVQEDIVAQEKVLESIIEECKIKKVSYSQEELNDLLAIIGKYK